MKWCTADPGSRQKLDQKSNIPQSGENEPLVAADVTWLDLEWVLNSSTGELKKLPFEPTASLLLSSWKRFRFRDDVVAEYYGFPSYETVLSALRQGGIGNESIIVRAANKLFTTIRNRAIKRYAGSTEFAHVMTLISDLRSEKLLLSMSQVLENAMSTSTRSEARTIAKVCAEEGCEAGFLQELMQLTPNVALQRYRWNSEANHAEVTGHISPCGDARDYKEIATVTNISPECRHYLFGGATSPCRRDLALANVTHLMARNYNTLIFRRGYTLRGAVGCTSPSAPRVVIRPKSSLDCLGTGVTVQVNPGGRADLGQWLGAPVSDLLMDQVADLREIHFEPGAERMLGNPGFGKRRILSVVIPKIPADRSPGLRRAPCEVYAQYCISPFAAYDDTICAYSDACMLPPFVPSGRGARSLFDWMCGRLYPDDATLELPLRTTCQMPVVRSSEYTCSDGNVMRALLMAIPFPRLAPEHAMTAMGRELSRIADSCETLAKEEIVAAYWHLASQSSQNEEYGEFRAVWTDTVESIAQLEWRQVGPEIASYGKLLQEWPNIAMETGI